MMQPNDKPRDGKERIKKRFVKILFPEDSSPSALQSAARITVIYLIIGVLWILLSDRLLMLVVEDVAQFSFFQLIKGWFYVVMTAVVLFFLIQRQLIRFEDTQKELASSYEDLEITHEELIAAEEELLEKLHDLNKSRADLLQIEERYRLAIEGANDGIWDWDLKFDVFLFDRTKIMLGYEPQELVNTQEAWFSLVHPEDLSSIRYELTCHFENVNHQYRSIYRVLDKKGVYRWILSRGQSIRDDKGEVIRMAGSHTDISETVKSQEKIHHLAYFDSVTGLYNRFYFMEKLEIDIEMCRSSNRQIGILLLDLDNFKKVIDTLGHSYGDLLLGKVGKLIGSCLDKTATVYRFGGDEFVIISKEVTGITQVIQMAENILSCMKPAISIRNYESYVSASIGIALFPQHGQDVESLLKNAEVAMYEAKQKGKNGYHLFNDRLKNNFIDQAILENELRHAIEKKELLLHYQPKLDLNTHEIVGGEALIRWHHPTKGMISPMQFIPLAEENGTIHQLGKWVLQEVCRQNREWQQQGLKPIPLAVNLSARQFQERDLVRTIKSILQENRLRPEWLEIEVTETIAMQDMKYTVKILNELRKMGISIALDDFGTGYSSLYYLKHLPIDTVKIDKSFVHDLCESSSQSIIADAIIMMAHGMELTVTAEGIETPEQLAQLKKKSCDYAQGYYFYKPMAAHEFSKLLPKLPDDFSEE